MSNTVCYSNGLRVVTALESIGKESLEAVGMKRMCGEDIVVSEPRVYRYPGTATLVREIEVSIYGPRM